MTKQQEFRKQTEEAKIKAFSLMCEKVADLEKENAELIQENEEMKKGIGCETCQIHLEYMRLNDKIRELEQKLEQTEKDLADYQFNYPTIKELSKENAELRNNGFTVSAMTEQQLKVALEKGERLEKENAELKADNNARKFAMAMSEKVEKQLREENAELKKKIGIYQKGMYDEIEKRDKKVTKAKEIIKELLDSYKYVIRFREYANKEPIAKAEQFLEKVK